VQLIFWNIQSVDDEGAMLPRNVVIS